MQKWGTAALLRRSRLENLLFCLLILLNLLIIESFRLEKALHVVTSDHPPDPSPPLHSNCHIHMLPPIFPSVENQRDGTVTQKSRMKVITEEPRYLRAATHERKCWKCCCTLQQLLCYCPLCNFANSPLCCGKYFTEVVILVGCSSSNSICR